MQNKNDLDKFPACKILYGTDVKSYQISKKAEDCIKEIVETVDMAAEIMQKFDFGHYWTGLVKGKEKPLVEFVYDIKTQDDEFYRIINFDPKRSALRP